jgi:Flp pilus assembly protein TadG
LLTLVIIGVLAVGTLYLMNYREQQIAQAQATATIVAATVYPQQTATAIARAQATAARIESQTAAVQPSVVAGIGVGQVTNGGNLRREPQLTDNVIGLIWSGDQVTFLEQRDVGGQIWYRILVTQAANDRGGDGVPPGTEGWASSTLLSPPAPIP